MVLAGVVKPTVVSQVVVALFAPTPNLTCHCWLYKPSQHFAAYRINVVIRCAFIISSLNIFTVRFDPTANL